MNTPLLRLVPLLLAAGCASYHEPPLTAENPASPLAPEAASAPARRTLVTDEITRRTQRRFAAVKEAQTNPRPSLQQQGAPMQHDVGTTPHNMAGMSHQAGGMQMEGMQHSGSGPSAAPPMAASTSAKPYVCPMHPEVRSDKPGRCPKCGMKLVQKPQPPSHEGH